jgi:hypothetical protein
MASDSEFNATSALVNEVTNLSIGSEDAPSQFEEPELPEHNEHNIRHGGKVYKWGKACPAKQRDRSS